MFDIELLTVGSDVTKCFIRVEGERSRIRFSGNTPGKEGNVLLGGLLALRWVGNVNCLDSFKNNIISDLSEQNVASNSIIIFF